MIRSWWSIKVLFLCFLRSLPSENKTLALWRPQVAPPGSELHWDFVFRTWLWTHKHRHHGTCSNLSFFTEFLNFEVLSLKKKISRVHESDSAWSQKIEHESKLKASCFTWKLHQIFLLNLLMSLICVHVEYLFTCIHSCVFMSSVLFFSFMMELSWL